MTKQTKRRRRAFRAAILLLLGLGLAGIYLFHRLALRPSDSSSSTGPADPRLAYDGPYRNIHPEVRYVGNAQCADCHADIAQSYARHPMGRSLVPIESLLEQPQAFPLSAWERRGCTNNPFRILGRRFEVDRQGKRLWHRQAVLDESGKPVIELSLEVHWAIGSGAKGYTFLFERDGYLFETPISWFTQQQCWDLTPGFRPEVLTERQVETSCLFCHANRVREHPEQPHRFLPPMFEGQGIGCERCHGPGELHVRTADRWDIVNPARLNPELRDAVCEQCHLEGEARILRAGRKLFDYRPGLPLHDFWAVLVQGRQSGEDAKAVNHVEQMYQSKCFAKAVDGVKLGCITCHDPHVHIGPAQRQTYYRPKCLLCHDGTKEPPVCSEPLPQRKQVSPEDSCIACHMPRYRSNDIAHAASTDHRIVREPTRRPIRATDLENTVLVDFYQGRFAGRDPQTERTLGLGLMKMMRMNMHRSQRHTGVALRFLESALGRDPSDNSVRQDMVEAYLLLNRPAEALVEAEALVPEQPGNWELLVQAAYAAQGSGRLDRACDYWRRAVEINPFVAADQVHLVRLLIWMGQFDEARRYCEQLLRLDPFNVSGRQAWVAGLLLQQGRRAEAQRVFDVIRQLKPPDLKQREEWFKQRWLLSEPRP